MYKQLKSLQNLLNTPKLIPTPGAITIPTVQPCCNNTTWKRCYSKTSACSDWMVSQRLQDSPKLRKKCSSPQSTNGIQDRAEFTQSKLPQGFLWASQLQMRWLQRTSFPLYHLICEANVLMCPTSKHTLSCCPAPGSILLNLHGAHCPRVFGKPLQSELLSVENG